MNNLETNGESMSNTETIISLVAESGLPRKSAPPRPMEYMVDGTACTDDTLIYPRTMRQAFGHYAADPLPKHITFLADHRANMIGVIAAVAAVVFVAWRMT